MESILLSKYAVASFTQAFLGLLITSYLLASAKKDCSAWRLIMFFALLSISMCSSFLLMAVHTPWRSWFGPVQGLVSLLSLVSMIQFAYTFPGGEVSGQSKRALVISLGLAAATFGVGAVYEDQQEIVIVWLGVITVGLSVWAWAVFALRTRMFTQDVLGAPVSIPKALWSPAGREAQAHRAFARLMLLLIALGVAALAEGLGFLSLERLLTWVTSVYILFLIAFVFVYVNNAPSESSFMVKIVGISLVILMIVMGNMGTFILQTLERRFDEDRIAEMKFALKSVVQEDHAFLPKHVQHIYVYPLESEGGVELREEVYRRPDTEVSLFHATYVAPVFTANVIETMRADPSIKPRHAKEQALEAINRTDLLSWARDLAFTGMVQDLRCSIYYFTVTGFLFEVTYPRGYYGEFIHGYAVSLIFFVIGSTILILVFFPRFFKSSLNAPLQSLLGGMRAVNDGNMEVEVPIHTEDEFGFLTRSFNGMVKSIRGAEEQLKDYAVELEDRVEARTRDLNEKNIELERTLVELQETQNQLLLQEKMASIGQLVAGLAHEINNPIGVVSSSADVARRCVIQIDEELSSSETIEALRRSKRFVRSLQVLRDNIDVTTEAGERITRIVGTLRSFARLDEAEYQIAHLEEGIESTIALMRHQIPEAIEVTTVFGETPPIYCSPGELNQVFMALIRNAVSAIQDDGRIEVQTSSESDQVCVIISDTGAGIPKNRLDRIFEIGFTSTRDRVKMGTGLTTAYRVVNEHGGVIQIDSEVGRGTKVEISLPVKQS
jgi:signal transduction histidine kinase